MSLPSRSPRQAFVQEVKRPEEELDLARAALLVAVEEYPQLSVDRYIARLDGLAEEVKDRLDDESASLILLQELLGTLYLRHRFQGNREAYHDPRNSYLNAVLDRETGIPLTLGMVILEVGWRLGLPLVGVGSPLHFLVRFQGDVVRLLVDPFDGGRIFFEDSAQEILDRVHGGSVSVRPALLRTATRRDMLLRLLTNLEAYLALAPGASDVPRVRGMIRDLDAGRASP
jgi:regulator of sirC expression with transglutaminase-like and TPR domain